MMSCRLHTFLTGAACLAVCGLLALSSSQYLLLTFTLAGLMAAYWSWSADNRQRSIEEWLERRNSFTRPARTRRRRPPISANVFQFPGAGYGEISEAAE